MAKLCFFLFDLTSCFSFIQRAREGIQKMIIQMMVQNLTVIVVLVALHQGVHL